MLSWICAHPDALIVGSKLARTLGLSASAVGTELSRLERLGMLRAEEPIGPARPYRVNERFPLLHGLQSVCLYATGIVAVLRELFAEAEGVGVAAIFGSLARGDDRPDSDVDVLVVGEIDGIELARLAREAWRRTGREVMTLHYSVEELAEKASEAGAFLDRVLSGQLIFVKGDRDGLRRLALAEGGEDMSRKQRSVEEVKADILRARDEVGFSMAQMDRGDACWTIDLFCAETGADERVLNLALSQLCAEKVLQRETDPDGTEWHAPYDVYKKEAQ
ncbi:MAG: nucleotidyltransferase family protein [Armatimonadota bacterium]